MINLTRSGLSFTSSRIIESAEALVPPKPAISDDMRAMVDVLTNFGQIRSKPGAYRMADGTMIIHPVLRRELDRHVARQADLIKAESDRMLLAAILGRKHG
ncbi:hypothetical protein [Pararhizobium arenae]|uniref:hypothetical protein n=1 Tax=Pararhizobium arenae TaxID=1856850 RepID=UPI00094AD3AC|nr:hypothetical protein [Pararhizobium arenae]